MENKKAIEALIDEIWRKLTPDGRSNVRDHNKPLRSVDLKEQSDPEAFTKHFLIEEILDLLNVEILPEKQFYIWGKRRSVDYILKNPKDAKFLMEAKPINADLFAKDESGAVNQIKGLFQHAKAKEEHDFGIATDGLRCVFINKKGEITEDLAILEDFQRIKELLTGEKPIAKISEEEITAKFYSWYNALLHGGRYKDHQGNIRHISEKDSFVENIRSVERIEDREQIAQIIMDRLIFIKFLQSKGIIKNDVLRYISEYPEDTLVPKLRQLFFKVLNTDEEERFDLDKQFEDIPYLNGSLFNLTEIERKNTDFRIKAEILKEVINFLDGFKFIHREEEETDSIDPEILGYIFERAMTALDRKGTGSYYTPKVITRYIVENTIYPSITEKVNRYLLEEKGYRDTELIKTIEELFILPATTVNEIWNKIIMEIKVLDNACGSGAFLLQAANILFDLNRRIDNQLSIGNSDTALKKLILIRNIYGVDINPNAIEIAKLRLWLWLADSYNADHIEALPNIDYNLRVGNSLIGYLDIAKFRRQKVSLMDYFSTEKPLFDLLRERMDLLEEYRWSYGRESKDLRDELIKKDEQIRQVLNINLYQEFIQKKIKIAEEEFENLNPFHWGFEFYDVFENRGFDVVVGNPPYVRQELIKELKPLFKELYPAVYTGTADLSVYFVKRSLDLTKSECYHSFIITNKWLRAKYGGNLRNYLTENIEIDEIIDFNGVRVFVGATVDVLVYILKNMKPENNKLRYYNYSDSPLQNIKRCVKENGFDIEQETLKQGWSFYPKDVLEIKKKIEEVGKPLKEWNVKINYGIKTGFNEAFIIDEEIKNRLVKKDKKCVEIIKPILRGRDIRRYGYDWKNLYIIFTRQGINIDEYPTVKEYLSKFRERLEPRPRDFTGKWNGRKSGHYKWYELQDTIAYYDDFDKTKIVWQRVTKKPSFLIGAKEFYIHDSLAFFTSEKANLKYLGAILNSKLMHFYLDMIGHLYSNTGYLLSNQYLERFPIIELPEPHQIPFIHLADYMLFLNATEERRKNEKELIEFIDSEIIDSLVYERYFREKFETDLIELVEPYLVDIEGIDDEMRSNMIEKVVDKIKKDGKVMMEIERIKSHAWVRVVEGV